MSKESQELRDLLGKNGQIREFLERVARGSMQVERGGFILRGVNGNESPLYKIVEELSNTPEPDSIDLYAWPARPGGNWAGALFPVCLPFATLALANLPARLSADPHYRVRFWWHTHLTGLVTDPASRMHITGASRPWGDDLKDKGVVGLMVQYDAFPERFRSFPIERNGNWFPLSPALFSGSALRAANFDPEQARDEKGRWTTEDEPDHRGLQWKKGDVRASDVEHVKQYLDKVAKESKSVKRRLDQINKSGVRVPLVVSGEPGLHLDSYREEKLKYKDWKRLPDNLDKSSEHRLTQADALVHFVVEQHQGQSAKQPKKTVDQNETIRKRDFEEAHDAAIRDKRNAR
jgi:hypothetical protein